MKKISLNPIGKPRMVRSDKWKKRPVILKYFAWKNQLNIQAKQLNISLTKELYLIFLIAMPDSWTGKKKDLFCYREHLVKPDTDNVVKGFKDSLYKQDSAVFIECAAKFYAYKGEILYFDNVEDWKAYIERIHSYRKQRDQKLVKMPKYITQYYDRA